MNIHALINFTHEHFFYYKINKSYRSVQNKRMNRGRMVSTTCEKYILKYK